MGRGSFSRLIDGIDVSAEWVDLGRETLSMRKRGWVVAWRTLSYLPKFAGPLCDINHWVGARWFLGEILMCKLADYQNIERIANFRLNCFKQGRPDSRVGVRCACSDRRGRAGGILSAAAIRREFECSVSGVR